eukprot:TRINITY_DN1941_c0_g1_i1.p1 TRINITY_DN1941_c0_g1~~TRINITY_DN1941_c0_g1_i1.p1  ORF type:complete len:122 (-),score=26.15 TRINITY_DN1941_c0_g1_i1:96-407(-)
MALSGFKLFSRRLLDVPAASNKIWPRFANETHERTGRRFFKIQAKGPALVKWYEPNLKEMLKDTGYEYQTRQDVHREKKKLQMRARGKKPVRKGEGKKSSRRK